ncbi:MAG: hypothetical protein V3R87_01985 [Dehalococcoidia bacterium]
MFKTRLTELPSVQCQISGPVAGLIRDLPSAKELVDRIVAQAGSIVERMRNDKLV